MQSHLSQSANDLIYLLLINDMSFLKPVLGSLPTVFIYQVNCASFGGGSGSTFNTLQCWKRRRGWGWRGSHESGGRWGKLRPRWNDAMRAGRLLRAVVGAWRRILRWWLHNTLAIFMSLPLCCLFYSPMLNVFLISVLLVGGDVQGCYWWIQVSFWFACQMIDELPARGHWRTIYVISVRVCLLQNCWMFDQAKGKGNY